IRRYLAHPRIEAVGDIEITDAIYCNALRAGELRRSRGSAVPAESPSFAAGDCADHSIRGYFSDSTRTEIGYIKIASRVHVDIIGPYELCQPGRPTVSTVFLCPVAGKCADQAVWSNFADPSIANIRDIQVP